jgi:hypothetical protein
VVARLVLSVDSKTLATHAVRIAVSAVLLVADKHSVATAVVRPSDATGVVIAVTLLLVAAVAGIAPEAQPSDNVVVAGWPLVVVDSVADVDAVRPSDTMVMAVSVDVDSSRSHRATVSAASSNRVVVAVASVRDVHLASRDSRVGAVRASVASRANEVEEASPDHQCGGSIVIVVVGAAPVVIVVDSAVVRRRGAPAIGDRCLLNVLW